MRCPVCKTPVLATDPLDETLLTMRCHECEGHWVKSFQYWKWRELQHDLPDTALPDSTESTQDTDSLAGKLCPECGHFLTRRPVGHGVDFNLDRCDHCGGIWFDKCEWETLVMHSLHLDVYSVFTKAWQSGVSETNRINTKRERLMKLLDERDYTELLRVGRWLHKHEHRAFLIACLNHPDITTLIKTN